MSWMSEIRSICVYCGSNPGRDPAFRSAAAELGEYLARNGIRLVYGGSDCGTMGIVAESALSLVRCDCGYYKMLGEYTRSEIDE